jgi:hypothetical protein
VRGERKTALLYEGRSAATKAKDEDENDEKTKTI